MTVAAGPLAPGGTRAAGGGEKEAGPESVTVRKREKEKKAQRQRQKDRERVGGRLGESPPARPGPDLGGSVVVEPPPSHHSSLFCPTRLVSSPESHQPLLNSLTNQPLSNSRPFLPSTSLHSRPALPIPQRDLFFFPAS